MRHELSLLNDIAVWERRASCEGPDDFKEIYGVVAGRQAYARRQAVTRRKMLEHAKKVYSTAPTDTLVWVDNTGNLSTDYMDVTQNLDLM